jgi:hypothetical protein
MRPLWLCEWLEARPPKTSQRHMLPLVGQRFASPRSYSAWAGQGGHMIRQRGRDDEVRPFRVAEYVRSRRSIRSTQFRTSPMRSDAMRNVAATLS